MLLDIILNSLERTQPTSMRVAVEYNGGSRPSWFGGFEQGVAQVKNCHVSCEL